MNVYVALRTEDCPCRTVVADWEGEPPGTRTLAAGSQKKMIILSVRRTLRLNARSYHADLLVHHR